mmetsp:Transcript_23976/g.32985  ORF Transcript_23976/g.32985 Transcript_23976/m.32985 type:complete len:329 (+) Transcript_23976:114-1100(+)|eukprot:CAMPEP_0196585878 /NCGR_PEP_ID=MMETSP1081-20130531/52389_1 /TAXON_ID=36882 /ORGANISM="Pyramimonas amylifera, Strain CCMP720" /LENGTH=328 /DNA_ID=CAMNT_0041907571 /DNA_START=112 /DNA_END=1098 /DNA_ORIENTATION=+
MTSGDNEDEVAELGKLLSMARNDKVQDILRKLMLKEDNTDAVTEMGYILSMCNNGSVRYKLKQGMAYLSGELFSAPQPSSTQALAPLVEKNVSDTKAAPEPKKTEAIPKQTQRTPVKTAKFATQLNPSPVSISSGAKASNSLNYETISTFSWEQTDDEVKILVPVEGVSKEIVSIDFTPNSFDLKVVGLNGKNFRCAVSPLHLSVDPAASSFMVPKSQKRVVVKLKKQKTSSYADKHWTDLKAKPAPAVKKTPENPDDPGAGIMDLMKNLYEDGDDEMKRTIAKAWTESREGKMPEMPEMPSIDPPAFDPSSFKMPPMPNMPNMPKFP